MASAEPLLTKKLDNVADINLGVDYKLNKKWGFWIDLNNIANMHYQRWNQYQAYGFNFLAGVRYRFLKRSIN
jgi:outer membrane cobalamin receptor